MKDSAPTLERADLNDQVYTSLKDALATRKLAPGEKLSLQELASAFGVSRSPVQHAFTRLVAEGFVEVRPHRGHFVKPLTALSVCEAHDVREAIELYAADKTVGKLTTQQLAELRRLMERTLAMLEGRRFSDRGGYITTNQAFHDFQVALAGNRLLLESYRGLSVNALMARVLSKTTGGDVDVGAEHVELVEAYEAGDLPRVEVAIRVHVETGKRLAVEAIKQAGGIL